MKFLEYTPLARVNGFLSNVNLGDCHIQGALEAYSCKVAGMDKKLSRSLEQEVLDSLNFSSSLSTSPVGPLSTTASRRTLIYLILTLNHMYPDYDFSMLRAHHFCKEPGLSAAKQKIEHFLVEASKVWGTEMGDETPLMDCLWASIDEVMDLADSDVYACVPDFEGDPFADQGSMWSFNYFFYNKKLKRILCFSCRCVSKMALDQWSEEDVSEEEYEFIEGMDMEE
ncbi:hypothetical protein R1flu_027814 [Riccia fluitans]|uniref:Repressor of RNA polymerase III transcription n=1 Tax=Riccia fluitans TaxID=41844 RepID=A0ABD1XMQ5_9MARC